ncbi:type II secretion system minor pseudopilin GspI, partial [Sphingomonas sp.]|uniref:type II secretion system minor pseudopilin GspI n=1 Tax=Sphingomonas sp. TaxID=28214 RepID=UPI001D837736
MARASGFTLLEVMVALVVFSLAALALIRLEGQAIRTVALLDDTALAQLVAHNVVVDSITDVRVPPRGETAGTETNGGRNWAWKRQVQPLGDQGAFRIDVTVLGADGAVAGRLTAVRPPAVPPRAPAQGAA